MHKPPYRYSVVFGHDSGGHPTARAAMESALAAGFDEMIYVVDSRGYYDGPYYTIEQFDKENQSKEWAP